MHVSYSNVLSFLFFVIPAALLVNGEPVGSDEGNLFQQLQKERKMRESAILRIRELETARTRTERQFDTLRAAFAELYLENQALRTKSRELRLQAAQLTLNKKTAGAAEVIALDARLDAVLRHRRQAEQGLRELQVQLQTFLELEDGSDALKTLVTTKLNRVFDELNRMAEVGDHAIATKVSSVREAAVLAIHPELQLIILNKGEQHGVTAGSNWTIHTSRKRPIRVQVVSLRPRISAALIRSGSTDDATPGLTARRQISEPNHNNNPNK